ncbi:SusC/RagA family TonB-linked outer membrane protein [Hymenobacter terrenus]|uniref:SusC/RagA family TonB-linked outer membrane protein n=1 Tax=Hymenobacter terrenus TaxID=1629124 RepID=UPI000696F1A6|nr:TonB-dependent receptor [Hymenobacter terrenus]
MAQSTQAVSGRVVDEKGQALPGVTVLVKNTSNGTTTGADGSYTLSITSGNPTLVISYIGYLSQEIPVNGRTEINVNLAVGDQALEEVVVVGYGTQQRKDLTGAVSSVKSEEIARVPVSSADQALQGQVAGVQIANTSGEPGGSPNIRIRGVSSISGGVQPLVVIDGFPVNNADGTNPLNAIDPRDIESIDVLKDASATAIYGSRGSNGVIIVTTKRGKLGKTKVNVDVYGGVQQVAKTIDMMNPEQFAQFTIDARNNGYLDNFPTANINDTNAMRRTRAGNDNYAIPPVYANPSALRGSGTDWQKEIFRVAPITNYKVTLGGGTDALKYSVSAGYFDQQGVVLNTYLRRFNFKANLDSRVSDKVKIGISLIPTYSEQKRLNTADHYASYGIIQAAMAYSPAAVPRDSVGNFGYNIGDLDVKNPLRIADEYKNTNDNFRILANSYLEYDITSDLKLRTTIGGDYFNNQSRLWIPSSLAGGSNYTAPASARANNQINTSWLNENTLSYRRAFSEDHRIDAVIGATFQRFYTNQLSTSAANFANDQVQNVNGGNVNAGGEIINRDALTSFLARVNYTLFRRFLFTGTVRTDGSSKFSPEGTYQWGTFPSGSFAYRLTEESFMKALPAITDLKFRVGYGLTGNNSIGNYRFLALLAPSNYIFGEENVRGLSPSTFQNDRLSWESLEQVNLGLDVALFKNRVTLTADYYNRVNKDMLFNIQTPAATGLTTATLNLGSVRNRGVELTVATQNVVSKSFTWNSNFNISYNENKVLSMSTDAEKIFANGSRGITNVTQVGGPVGGFYGRRALGVFQTDQEAAEYGKQPFARAGDVKWADVNENGIVDDDDRVALGNPLPKYTLGINNTFTYQAFSLDIFTNAVLGNKLYNGLFAFNNSGVQNNATYIEERRWRSPEEPGDGRWGRAIRAGRNNNTAFSDLYLFDASFWRIRNVSLNYSVPNSFAKRFGMQAVRINVTGTNLYTFSDYPGYDPEVGATGNNQRAAGTDNGTFPIARTVTVGLNATF